ncbi:MAG: DUF4957 domain-containing protein [Prevotella sp.]|nr:DUF4957 domain-containing protein [Prevotella sp.]
MSKNHLIAFGKLCSLLAFATGGLLLASCADDGYDDKERFESSVRNTQLASPKDATISASADGKSQTITWPVVHGAGGYQVTLYDASDMGKAIVDSLVEGCSVTFKREEDVNYVLRILAKGNTALGNTDASEATQINFSTFTPTFKTIPAGSDLNEWFAANPIAEDVTEMVNYDLEGGGQYTVSAVLDFDGHPVTLRSNSKSNPAKITYTTAESGITTTAAMSIKYLDFDCSGMEGTKGVFAFSKTTTVPAANTIDPAVYKWTGAYISNPISIVNCNFDNVNGYFFWDNAAKTWAETLLVDNCVVHLTPQTALGGGVFWTNKAGQFNNLYVTNSTFYESPDNPGDYKYFYQAGMAKAPDLYVDNSSQQQTATNSVNYQNCTFYHVAWNNGQWGNYNGMQSKSYSYWIMTDCIFYDCSTSGSVPRRFLHGRSGQLHAVFNNNTYMSADGTFQDPGSYDVSGTIIEEDPMFANPSAGDFHISGATQVARKTGDPRWLPGAE